MIPSVALPIVRRAILDLLNDIGGEHNDLVLSQLLLELGHRVARRDVAEQLVWLAETAKLIHCEKLGPFHAARILQDGRDVASGLLSIDGVSRFKTGE